MGARSNIIVKGGRNNKHELTTNHSTRIRSPRKSPRKKSGNSSSLNAFDKNDKERATGDLTNVQTIVPTSPSTLSKEARESRVNIVTPSSLDLNSANKSNILEQRARVVRHLLLPPLHEESNGPSSLHMIKPDLSLVSSDDESGDRKHKSLPFGRTCESTNVIQSNTREVYKAVSRMTGSIGGNGNGGAIYGELTIGSMQKMVDLMKEHTNLNENSRFIDVGCGLGKPNLHVAQDPGVQLSYGVEMERVRWLLAMCNLDKVFDAALEQKPKEIDNKEMIGHRCVFEHGDISDAEYFDPFTHVYMFDIGFPPKLFKQLATMFNKSHSPYLICYHAPRLMVDAYGFSIELIVQAPTSMHGSSEGHTAYIYRRVKNRNRNRRENKCPTIRSNSLEDFPCDPMFLQAWKSSQRNLECIAMDVKKTVITELSSSRSKRNRTPTCKSIY